MLRTALISILCIASFATGCGRSDDASQTLGAMMWTPPRKDMSYVGADGKTYKAAVFLPPQSGKRPLFIWIPGTIDTFDTPVAVRIAQTMAERGAISVTVGYNNAVNAPGGCEAFDAKAKAVFDPTQKDSLLAKLQAEFPELDVNLGVAVAGHSQGSFLATRAPKHLATVKAAWLLGTGNVALGLTTCSDAKTHGMKAVRAVNGEADFVFGNARVNRDAVQAVSGYCVGCSQTRFLQKDGAGYVLVRGIDKGGAVAGHNYYQDSKNAPDKLWDKTLDAWGRIANQEWIAQRLGLK